MRLIGRDEELAALASYLERRTPGVVVLDGDAGLGRHALLAAACEQVPPWRLAPGGGRRLYVEPRTTIAGINRRLHAILDGAELTQDAQDAAAAVRVLGRLAPAILVLDRYRPPRHVDRWLTDGLLRRLRSEDVPVVIAVLDPPDGRSRLTAAADLRLEIGALPDAAVRVELAHALRDVRPAVGADELERYVPAIAQRPGLFGPLVRLLNVNEPG